MIKFFRKIRQQLLNENKTGKYLKYAIGEILLVVVGILIALQVNNWNEKRKEQKQISIYLNGLSQEIERDISMIKVIQYQAEQVRMRIDSLSLKASNVTKESISNLDVVCLTWMNMYRPYSWNRATLEELKSSGSLKLIGNTELSKKIVSYDALTHHMDEDYNTDKVIADYALQLLSNVVDYKYSNGEELYELLRVTSNQGHLDDIFSSEEYKKATSNDLTFISDNKDILNSAVNSFIRLGYNIKIRTDIELPELVENANEILEMIKNEFQNQIN